MAITKIQLGPTAVAAGASVSAAWSTSTAFNNLGIAHVVANSANIITTAASGWVKVAEAVNGNARAAIFYKDPLAANEAGVTFTSTAASNLNARLMEWAGAPTINVADQNGTGSGVASPITATTAAAESQSGDIVFCAGVWILSVAGTGAYTHAPNNGITVIPSDQAGNAAVSSTFHYFFWDGFTTSHASADSTTESYSAANITNGAVILASFMPLGSTAGVITGPTTSA